MRKQGAWLNWEEVSEWSISWKDLWGRSEYAIKFMICSVYDLLPTVFYICKPGAVGEAPKLSMIVLFVERGLTWGIFFQAATQH